MKKFLLTLTALGLAASSVFAQVTTNEPAKDFTLKDTKGVEHSLSQHKGQYVVLEWVNHQCPFVVKQYGSGNMQSLQKEFTDKGVVWLSINSSAEGKEGYTDAAAADRLTQEKGAAPTAFLLDTDGRVGKMYGAQTTPHMYIIDPQGVLIYQGAIDNIASADQSDIAKAQNYVKSALNEAMAGNPVSVSTTKSYGCGVKYN